MNLCEDDDFDPSDPVFMAYCMERNSAEQHLGNELPLYRDLVAEFIAGARRTNTKDFWEGVELRARLGGTFDSKGCGKTRKRKSRPSLRKSQSQTNALRTKAHLQLVYSRD